MGKPLKKNMASNVVYIIVDGHEYRVGNEDGAQKLIDLTELHLPKKKRLRAIDIKGLGVMRFRSRKTIRNKGNIVCRLKFEFVAYREY